ncbi:amino acid adenylation domain-containing protein [Streptomyces sp. NPDC050504]|uniref:amino acid adenylation domain-containing protein n=1 Tax=Streptomyces sp. NPDC050504 TaxID=3365618 RepID=UPI0037B741B0
MNTAPLSIEYGPKAAPCRPRDVLERFEHWVRETPAAPAVEDGELSWTYAELDALADLAAAVLRDRVAPGDLVGVCLDRSVALVATAVAVARLGAVYLPLGPRPGERRLAAVAENLDVPCLIGDPGLLPEAYLTGEPLLLPLPRAGANAPQKAVAAFAPAPSTGRPARQTAPDGTFYTVLTSGSTGTPKAVAVGGASFASLLSWYRERTGSGPGDRHSLLVGVAFDPHVKELWAALTSGAALSVPPEEVRWDPAALTGWWRRAGVSVAVLPTPLAETLFERPWPELPALRHVFVGGDRLRCWPAPEVTARIHNAYGPAEATVQSTAHALLPEGVDTTAAPPIGSPIAGAFVCVTDGAGSLVPRGEPGELRIGGAGLALGYLDAELTARRFVPAPAGVTGTDRVYRTGDRVRMRADGVLEFLGRMDDQVKVSGVRIEPAEVEAAFEHDDRVLRAVVAAHTGTEGVVRLIAFVRPAPGRTAPEVADLLGGVRQWLPEQAVPAVVRFVDAFPLDANGKVDRAALLADEERRPVAAAGDDASLASATPTERLVVEICRDLLGLTGIGLADGFSDSGGTSLLAARLLAALEERCGVRLRGPEVLRQPDLRSLARLVDARLDAHPDSRPDARLDSRLDSRRTTAKAGA